ncbi:MAG TPA: prolyl oligopeptidase family serine peptidase [Anaerolineae bacterium]|nr:prolyl oligopeptidase family serine peptidase [Anaerolineae bacterium]
MAFTYPPAERTSHVDVLHGVAVPDPYRWLEDLDSEQTRQWVEAENQLTFAYLEQLPAREKIRQRLTQLWDYDKFGTPYKHGGRYFFTQQTGLQNQAVLYWMEALDAEPQALLDPNGLSEDGTVALTNWAISDDGRLLAYALSASGSDWLTWRVREVDTGRDRADLVEWSKFSGAAWTKDNAGFFYGRYDAPKEGEAFKSANYFHKLYYHRLGTPQADDALVYERPDQKEWGFGGDVTEDGRYLIITVWLGTNRENGVFYRDLQDATAPVIELLNTFDAAYGFLGNDGPLFYFRTDLDAPKERVIAIDIRQPERTAWREIVPESDDALQSVTLVQDWFVAITMHDAHSEMRVLDKEGRLVREIALPGLGQVAGCSGRRADDEIFYPFTSFTTPGTIYRATLSGGESAVFRCPQVGFDPTDYVTEQVFYASKDGTRVPMFITHRKDVHPNPDTPTFLYGYGGFNIPMLPAFSATLLVWMELGGVYAQANLRGGGEYGKVWHDDGRLINKQNVFDDFIAAAEWLIANGYTSTPRLAIGGGSNGGLLVGACLTQRPDLYGACLPAVGVLDMLRFHQWTIGWAWTSDYGSPDDATDFQALLAYSPYHNVKVGVHYPPTLITTADHDDRVFPAHSFKFAAALQHAQAGDAPVLIRIETKAGHGMGKPTAKIIEEAADRWAFVVAHCDVKMDTASLSLTPAK